MSLKLWFDKLKENNNKGAVGAVGLPMKKAIPEARIKKAVNEIKESMGVEKDISSIGEFINEAFGSKLKEIPDRINDIGKNYLSTKGKNVITRNTSKTLYFDWNRGNGINQLFNTISIKVVDDNYTDNLNLTLEVYTRIYDVNGNARWISLLSEAIAPSAVYYVNEFSFSASKDIKVVITENNVSDVIFDLNLFFSKNFDEAIELPSNVYYVSTDTELDSAISEIESNNYSAKIYITADLTNVQATVNDSNVDIEIEGLGHTLEANGNNNIITVTSVNSIVIKNIRFDCVDFTSVNTCCIDIVSISKSCWIENCTFYGDGSNGIGVKLASNYSMVIGCFCESLQKGIYLTGSLNSCYFNYVTTTSVAGIQCSGSSALRNHIHGNIVYGLISSSSGFSAYAGADYNIFSNNRVEQCTLNSATNTGGIIIQSDSDYNMVIGNFVKGCTNVGSGTFYGIRVWNSDCDETTIVGNTSVGNENNYTDTGTNTYAQANNTA